MQSDNTNIDTIVQDAFAASDADTSKQTQHWKQMQAMLQHDAKPLVVPFTIKRFALLAASLFILLTTGYFIWQNNIRTKKIAKEGTKPTLITAPVANGFVAFDTGVSIDTKITASAAYLGFANLNSSVSNTYFATFAKAEPFTINFFPCDSTVKKDSTNEALTINTFFDKIAKPEQQFEVDAATGGAIKGTEGTEIKIPPMAFGTTTGKVTIKLEEYYKYSDIIAANLNTVSNGEQLVTGGMIKLTAWQNDKEVALANGKNINLLMPTNNYDPDMQLFLGEENKKPQNTFKAEDFVGTVSKGNGYNRRLNWNVVNRRVIENKFDGTTNFLNMDDNPYSVRTSAKGKTIAKFKLTDELPMTTVEAQEILKKKYGDWYDVIKIKKVKPWRRILFSKLYEKNYNIGDSVKLTLSEALKGHYINKKDSAFYSQKIKADSIVFERNNKFNNLYPIRFSFINSSNGIMNTVSALRVTDSLIKMYEEQSIMRQVYNFSVSNMGWINCDRFYKYSNKIDFVVNLPKEIKADKFVTQLVFTKIKSVMQGGYSDNQIGFLNIPKGMDVVLLGLGEQNGKVVSFIQPLKTTSNEVTITELKETTPEEFRKELRQFDF